MAKGAGVALYRSFHNLRGLPRMSTDLTFGSFITIVIITVQLHPLHLFSLLEHPVQFYRSTDRLLQQLVQDCRNILQYWQLKGSRRISTRQSNLCASFKSQLSKMGFYVRSMRRKFAHNSSHPYILLVSRCFCGGW